MWRSCVLMAACGITLPLLVQGGRDSAVHEHVENFIARWRSVLPSDRDRAGKIIAERWAIWTEEEMQAVRRARRDPDPEVATRARAALASIERHRRWGTLADRVDELLAQVRASAEPASWQVWSIPGDLDVRYCSAARALADLGPAVEPLVLPHLSERKLQGAIAVVLTRIGSERCLGPPIAAMPAPGPAEFDPLSPGMLILFALQELTHAPVSVDLCRMGRYPWSDRGDLRGYWRQWHEANRNYLYTDRLASEKRGSRVLVDSEAKASGVSRREYRRGRREVAFAEVQTWEDSAEYAARLRGFCVTLLLRNLYPAGRPDPLTLQSLAVLNDPLATAAIERLRALDGLDEATERDVCWARSVSLEADAVSAAPVEPVSEERIAHLRRWLEDPNRSARLQAAVRLCELGCEEGLPTLREIVREGPLSHPDDWVVDTACRELPANPHPAAIELFREALGGRLGALGSPDTTALAIQGDGEAVQQVVDRLRSGETRLVETDFRGPSAVERIGRRELIPAVLPLLAAEDRSTRINAARAIVRLLDRGR